MAPTETLAEQHFLTIADLCLELGVSCALLTSSSRKRERETALGADVVVGTHALIQEGFELRDLAVAVVDEQHRFGVEQRSALVAGRAPHVLHMTATPIPRTLALTVYGDLAVSEIAKPPASRKPVITSWITEDRASEAYTRLTRLLREGRQAYVVCPLIEASETSLARAAEEEAERLRRAELREFRVGCLHGRLKAAERRDLMARFKACELDVLVATTVIEVGVDVANATVMIVQEADRFGLAQLHQLRGRVGRGAEQSYCLLVSRAKEELTESAHARLQALCDTSDGFELAEVDLELRGGGALLGTRQSGLSDLRFAHLRRDRDLLERARAVAPEVGPGPLQDAARRALRRGRAGGARMRLLRRLLRRRRPTPRPADPERLQRDLPRDASPRRRAAPRRVEQSVEQQRKLPRALEHGGVARVELERLDAEDVAGEMPLPIRPDRGVPRADDIDGPLDRRADPARTEPAGGASTPGTPARPGTGARCAATAGSG